MTHTIFSPFVNLNLHKQTKTCTFALLTTTYCKNTVSMNISAFYVSLIGPDYYQATNASVFNILSTGVNCLAQDITQPNQCFTNCYSGESNIRYHTFTW